MYFPLYQKTNAIVISYDILLAPFISVFTLPQQKTCMLHMIINLGVFFLVSLLSSLILKGNT